MQRIMRNRLYFITYVRVVFLSLIMWYLKNCILIGYISTVWPVFRVVTYITLHCTVHVAYFDPLLSYLNYNPHH